jgi:hypothetical protein
VTSRDASSLWGPRIALALAVFAPLCQWAVGAKYGPTGQQLTAGLPLPTLALLAAIACLVLAGEWRLPFLAWPQLLFLGLVSMGLFGLSRQEWRTGIKELVQVVEIAVLAPFAFRALRRRLGLRALTGAFALAFGALLALRFLPWSFGLSARKTGLLLVLGFPFALVALRRVPGAPARFLLAGSAGALLGLSLDHGGLVLGAVLAGLVLAWASDRREVVGLALAGLVLGSVLTPFAAPWSALRPHRDDTHLRRGTIELLATIRAPRQYPLGAGLGCYQPAVGRLRTEIAEQPSPQDNRVPQDGNCQYAVLLVEAGIPGLLGIALFLGLGLYLSLRRPVAAAGSADDHAERVALTSALAGAACGAGFGLLLSRGVGIWVGGLVGLATVSERATTARRVRRLVWCGGALLGIGLLAFGLNGPVREAGAPSRLNRRLASPTAAVSPLRVAVLPDPAADATDSRVCRIEAEAATEIEQPFANVALGDASGGRGLAIPDHGGKGKGYARFTVPVPESGTYVLYARVYWEDGCSNSVRFVVGGHDGITLASGNVQVEIQNLEDGIRIDYWGLRPR